MLAAVVQSVFSRLGGQLSQSFGSHALRKETTDDSSNVVGASGNIYTLEGIIGKGGLSDVYRAIRKCDGKAVALKIANLKKAPEAAELLSREAELMLRFNHPNIVQIFDSGYSSDGDPFIAMELLKGQTLDQLLISETTLDLERVASISLQVAEAVQHAHEKGVLHRDIKPANIMLVERNGKETAIVLDFGISLRLDEDGSSYDETSSGSLLYASPEQLSEQHLSYNTDVYQLALVMFEALTGRLPFEISVYGALNYRCATGPVLLSDEQLGEKPLHAGVRRVLENALERNPGQRTRNMASFMNELRNALCQSVSWTYGQNAA